MVPDRQKVWTDGRPILNIGPVYKGPLIRGQVYEITGQFRSQLARYIRLTNFYGTFSVWTSITIDIKWPFFRSLFYYLHGGPLNHLRQLTEGHGPLLRNGPLSISRQLKGPQIHISSTDGQTKWTDEAKTLSLRLRRGDNK